MIDLPKPAHWSLKAKFALCSGALMFAFSVAFTTWTLRSVQTDLRSSIVDAQRALLKSTARDIEAKVELRQDALVTIAALLSDAAPAQGAPMDTFFAPRPVLRKMFDAVLVVDAKGHVVYDSRHRGAPAEEDVAARPYFKTLAAGAGALISAPMRPLAGGEPFIVFAAPLHGRDGKFSGALVCSLNLQRDNFLGQLSQVRIGREGYFTIVERNDSPMFVMHKDPQRIMTPAAEGAINPVQVQASKGLDGTLEGPNSQGINTLRSFTPLRSVPWILLAVYPTDEAFAQLHNRQREVIWMGLGLFLAASAGAWLMSARLLQPLTRLRVEMHRHASQASLPMAPESFGSTELSALVRAYNAQALRRSEFERRLEDSERFMKDITDNMPALVAYVDRDQVYRFANAKYFEWFGVDAARLVGHPVREVLGPARYETKRPWLESAMAGQRVRWEDCDFRGGKKIDLQIEYIPDLAEDGVARGCYALSIDITERRNAERSLELNLAALKQAQALEIRTRQRLRAITDNLPAMIGYIDKDERYSFLNGAFRSWLGVDPDASVGRHFADIFGAEIYAARAPMFRRCLAGERIVFEVCAETVAGKKTLQIDYVPDFSPDGAVAGFYTLGSDVTELKDAQRQLGMLLRSDSLTGLANRYQFNEALPLALARCGRSGLAMALMFLDVDHFKQVNDTLGHAAGDTILKEFARRLQQNMRSTDTVARLGGDEFVVILEGLSNDEEPHWVARKILACMDHPFEVDGRPLKVTTSVGIAFHTSAAEGAADLLGRADAALYQAKAAGRNTVRLSTA
jgi:diguanylate cyclase (GGDEF)-like protein/PAS domain S-box-containing protein